MACINSHRSRLKTAKISMGKKHHRDDDEHERRPAKESKTTHRDSSSGDDASSSPSGAYLREHGLDEFIGERIS